MSPAAPPPSSAPAHLWLRLALVAGLVAASLLYGRFMDRLLPRPELPVLTVIDGDLAATERSGKSVRFSDLRGKVVVAAYLYTQCPHGCAAVTAQLQKLHADFASHPRLHLLSVALQPERDTPAQLRAYAEAVGARPDSPWWFITGDRQQLWDFMTREVGLAPAKPIPEEERLTPDDTDEHDLRITLIDDRGRVRGYYAVFHPQPEIAALMAERLYEHVGQLLADLPPLSPPNPAP